MVAVLMRPVVLAIAAVVFTVGLAEPCGAAPATSLFRNVAPSPLTARFLQCMFPVKTLSDAPPSIAAAKPLSARSVPAS